MPLTFIDTNKLPREKTAHGEITEILNEKLAGAKNLVASLRWLHSGDSYVAEAGGKHQLIYLMDGKASIELENKHYDVAKGAGVYLGPAETATIRAGAGDSVKLLQLVVPKIPE
jgi:glyoxylate utilization-related uncharacterized protein